jgi:hypothetical protein
MVEASALGEVEPVRMHIRVASLCFLVLFLEGYDITAMSYAIMLRLWRSCVARCRPKSTTRDRPARRRGNALT